MTEIAVALASLGESRHFREISPLVAENQGLAVTGDGQQGLWSNQKKGYMYRYLLPSSEKVTGKNPHRVISAVVARSQGLAITEGGEQGQRAKTLQTKRDFEKRCIPLNSKT